MSNIEKLNKTAKTLYSENFDIFRSNVCHFLHNEGDKRFLFIVLKERIIDQYYNADLIACALYMVAMLDYVSKENNVPICTDYNSLRAMKMKNFVIPLSIKLSKSLFDDDKIFKELYNQAIPEFLQYNILESDVRNVV